MHNSEPAVRTQNATRFPCRKAECECPLSLFVPALWSLAGTSTHWCLCARPFGDLTPTFTVPPQPFPEGGLSSSCAPSGNHSHHPCRLSRKATLDLTQKPLHSPLLSQFPSKTWSCQCPFLCTGCFRPSLASCFAFVKPTDQASAGLTSPFQPGHCPWPNWAETAPPALLPRPTQDTQEGGPWRVVPLSQHHL